MKAMYAKYHTEAVVVSMDVIGENDAYVTLYTADFGLIRARARALREERSRMRYAVQTGAISYVSLIRGTRGWRLAGARAESSALEGDAARAYARVLALVDRLGGEEANDALFEALSAGRDILAEHPAEWDLIELLSVARVLRALGFLSDEALGRVPGTSESLPLLRTERERYLRLVNDALAVSRG